LLDTFLRGYLKRVHLKKRRSEEKMEGKPK
jgi:hypothetical protein